MNRLDWVRENAEGDIIDIGGQAGHTFENATVVDIDEYEGVIQADAHDLPFEDNRFDTAVLAEVLEHVEDPVQVLKEARRVAGKIIITVPNEYEWPDELNPLMTPEEKAEAKGKSLEELAGESKALEVNKNYEHLWHRRFYTKELLESHLEQAGIKKYMINSLEDGKFVFFTVII